MRNEMMHRPVVKPELVEYMRTKQKKLPGELGKWRRKPMKQGADYSTRNSSFSTIFARTTKAQKYFRNRGSNWFFFKLDGPICR